MHCPDDRASRKSVGGYAAPRQGAPALPRRFVTFRFQARPISGRRNRRPPLPTNGVVAVRNALKRLSTELARSAAQVRTGSAMRSLAPRSSRSNRLPRSLRVLSAMTTVFGSAMLCSRAARFGVSPTMPRSCASPDPIRSPTTTKPVAMPTRVCSDALVFSAVTAATSSSAARTARSASSSCACG
jgi:hypothetical protein